MELYKRYRPKGFKGLVGQDGAVNSIETLVSGGKIPHAILLTGPSGCGKTTIARILRKHLECGEQDLYELNCADFRGIEDVREIRRLMGFSPITGKSRIWIIDEAHKLTNDAQNALLKILEDTPSHAYFFLCTTDPQKLLKTIHTRCTEIKLSSLSNGALTQLIQRVASREGMEISEDICSEMIEASQGSARKALVILEQVGNLKTEEEQIKAIQATSINKEHAIRLARGLINPTVTWGDVAPILKEMIDEPEGVRYLVLSYCRSVLLGGGKLAPRAFLVIDIFSDNFYDSKQAGLAAACWEVVHSR